MMLLKFSHFLPFPSPYHNSYKKYSKIFWINTMKVGLFWDTMHLCSLSFLKLLRICQWKPNEFFGQLQPHEIVLHLTRVSWPSRKCWSACMRACVIFFLSFFLPKMVAQLALTWPHSNSAATLHQSTTKIEYAEREHP